MDEANARTSRGSDRSQQPIKIVRSCKRWTKSEIAILRNNWGNVVLFNLMSKLPGRTKEGIVHKAEDIGLPKVSQGRINATEAAILAGYKPCQIPKIFEWAKKWGIIDGKYIHMSDKRLSSYKKKYVYYDKDDIIDAATAYANSETVTSFRKENNLPEWTLYRFLKRVLPVEAKFKGVPIRYPQGYLRKVLDEHSFFDSYIVKRHQSKESRTNGIS